MNDKVKNLTKNPKLLVILGICGIVLILISSLFPSGSNKSKKTDKSDDKTYTVDEYRNRLESDVKSIVEGITGVKNPTVVITLESGIRYCYASADETDTSSSMSEKNDQSSESKKQSYITVKNSDGGEQALIVTEIMPEVRGVAIICNGGNDIVTQEKIKNAETAALNITSKRVYISGGTVK